MKNKKLNILNIAWIGHGDFGDEVMAHVLRMYLKKIGVGAITMIDTLLTSFSIILLVFLMRLAHKQYLVF